MFNKYINKIIDRFKNPYLKDDVARVGREPLRKLNENDRLIKPLITARGFNINTDNLLLGVGAALHYDNKEDAQSVQLQSLINEKGIKESLAEISKISGDTDVLDKVEKYYDEVREQCDLVIGIYHGGFEYDLDSHKQLSTTSENIAYKICKEFDFDILLTGHQHLPIYNMNNGTHIAQTPHNGSKFLELKLSLSPNGTKEISSTLKELTINPNNEMYEKFLSLENKVQEWLDTPAGFLDKALQPTDRVDMALNGSHLANFINQIQLDASKAEIACTSFANVIKGFNKDVTVRDIMSTYPYPNTLVVLEVNREILKLALERSASYLNNDNGNITISESFLKPKVEHYNYDYFANIEYTFDLNNEIGNRVISIKYNGKELQDNKALTLVMNNYRASGAGGYECYDKCKVVKEIVLEMPEIIINYFKNNPKVTVDTTKYINTIK